MILDSLAERATENLMFTYFELGRAASKSRILHEEGFSACVGEFEHPICNFAAGLRLDPESAQRLAGIALDRATFNVYTTHQDAPADVGDLLIRAGFQRNYRMAQMVARPPSEPSRGILARASTRYDRMEIALFMVDQFFTKHNAPFRRRVAEATAGATALELLALRKDGRLLAGAMVRFDREMAGVYNVCVDASLRGLGVGSSVMREILSVCGTRGIPATLQCDPKLESWYGSLGFERIGEVGVYALAKANGAIMR